MDCSFPFAGFFEKKSENTQKKYIRDAITQRETGYRKEKMMPVPKEKRETGYRKEKMMPVPKEKRETGYRKETKSYFWVMCKRRKYGMLKVKKWVT